MRRCVAYWWSPCRPVANPKNRRGEITQRAHAFVLVLELHAVAASGGDASRRSVGAPGSTASPRRRRRSRRGAGARSASSRRRDRGSARLGGEVRVAWEDPRTVLPGLDGVLGQPSPAGHAGDLLGDPAGDRLARKLRGGPSQQRHVALGRQLAGHRDDLSAYVRGKGSGAALALVGLPRPARRCSKKRLRHCERTSRRQFKRAAISSLRSPSAASSTI